MTKLKKKKWAHKFKTKERFFLLLRFLKFVSLSAPYFLLLQTTVLLLVPLILLRVIFVCLTDSA